MKELREAFKVLSQRMKETNNVESLNKIISDYLRENVTQEEQWEILGKAVPISNEKRIKQLKKQARYSKFPMEVKKLNQEIMELQKELNNNRKVR